MSHIGRVGERVTLTVTTHEIEPVFTDFGEVAIHQMTTEAGHRLQWNASSNATRLPIGETLSVKATIKDHDFDDVGRPITHVWRVSKYEEPKAPPRIPKRTIGRPGMGAARRPRRR